MKKFNLKNIILSYVLIAVISIFASLTYFNINVAEATYSPYQLPYWLELIRGNITEQNRFSQGGNILDLSSGDGLRDIWNGPDSRTELTTATTLYFSSTDVGDDALFIAIGMDANFNEIVALAFLDGQNQVQASADIWKVFNIGPIDDGSFDGTIYFAESDPAPGGVPTSTKIQLVSREGFGVGAIARRTVPAGYTAYIRTLKITPNKGKDVTVYLASKLDGQPMLIAPAGFELFEYNFDTVFDPSFSIIEKQDLIFLGETNDTNAPVSVLFEGVLVKN